MLFYMNFKTESKQLIKQATLGKHLSSVLASSHDHTWGDEFHLDESLHFDAPYREILHPHPPHQNKQTNK